MAGEVLELDLAGEGGVQWRRFTRIKVNIDIEQPLLPRVFLPRPNLDDLCVRLNFINHVLALFHDKFACNIALRNLVFR